MRNQQTLWLIAILVAVLTHLALAAPVTWDGGGGDAYWDTPNNWDPDGVPGAGDDVSITNDYSVIISNVQSVGSVLITNATLTFQGYDTVQLTATNVTVAGVSGRITHTNYSTNAVLLPEHRVSIVCTNLTIATNAMITVNSQGFAGGLASASHPNGYGPAPGYGNTGGGGGGHGGSGALGYQGVLGGAPYDSALAPTNAGSGGGASSSGAPAYPGSSGGGVIRLVVTSALTNNGTISANGQVVSANQEQGGGAGGSIYVTCGSLAGNGAFTASGGYNTVSTGRGGGGGGGRIAVYGGMTGFTGSFSAVPGTGNQNGTAASAAQAGTLYIQDLGWLGSVWTGNFYLVVMTNVALDNLTVKCTAVDMLPGYSLFVTNLLSVTNTSFLAESNNTTTAGQMDLRGSAIFDLRYANLSVTNGDLALYNITTLYLRETATTTVSRTILVTNTANMVLLDRNFHPTNSVPPFTITASDVFVDTGATINADGGGFIGGIPGVAPNALTNGPGYGTGPNYGAGAGYGGRGGYGVTGAGVPGVAYGSNDQYCSYMTPTFAGSGGGPNPGNKGGAGGGVVRLNVVQTMTINGRVSADGQTGTGSDTGGGSGGSVYITASTVAGTGTIRAQGGNGNSTTRGGGGAGGRLAIRYVSYPFGALGTLSVAPGFGCTDGADYPARTGTTYVVIQDGYVALDVFGSPAEHGTPIPNGYGTWGFLPGTTVTNCVNSPADEASGVRYGCIGYAGTGDLTSGSGTQAVCTITSGATLTWLWTNVYYFALGTGTHGSVSSSSGWYTNGVEVTISATSDTGYHFTQWSGDIPSDRVNSNPATVVMDQPRTINAQFGKDDGEGKTWVGGTGYWVNAAGWDSPGMPGELDAVTITNGNVTLDIATTVASLLASNTTLTLRNWPTVLSASNITLRTNATLTHAACGTALTHRVYLVCTNLTVDAGASIDVGGAGYSGGASKFTDGYGPGKGMGTYIGCGAGHGGLGGYSIGMYGGPAGMMYDSATMPTNAGSGGGVGVSSAIGGAGAGLIRLDVSSNLTLNGRIAANGQTVTWQQDAGAGAGGSIYITCAALTGAGLISATGGVQSVLGRAGGGGGGRIAVHGSSAGYTGTFTAQGGRGGDTAAHYGQDGSLYLSDLSYFSSSCSGAFVLVLAPFTSLNRSSFVVNTAVWLDSGCSVTITNALVLTNSASLDVTNGAAAISAGTLSIFDTATLTLRNGLLTCGSILLTNSATLALQDQFTNRVSGDIQVGGSANLLIYDRNYHPTNSLPPGIIYANNICVDTGATINADGLGFIGGIPGVTPNALTNGPGYGTGPTYGAGGGFGGSGGKGVTGAGVPGIAYGSNDQYCTYMTPTFAGSGGGPTSGNKGGAGGGVVRLNVVQTMTINGRVSADGQTGTGSDTGGGSGGSVYVKAKTLAGTGTLRAKGGDGNTTLRGGAGGGGRIAVYCAYNHYFGIYSATNGIGCSDYVAVGEVGTIYWRIQGPGTMFYVR